MSDDPPHPGQPFAQRLLQAVDRGMDELDAAATVDPAMKRDVHAVVIDPDPHIVNAGERPLGGNLLEKMLDGGDTLRSGGLAGKDARLERLDMGLDLDLAPELGANV